MIKNIFNKSLNKLFKKSIKSAKKAVKKSPTHFFVFALYLFTIITVLCIAVTQTSKNTK